ncbi:MAG: M48 family metallopeptidase [Cyanobacteria bacterium Co-bin8]|nr:M48 family metallopeptidase [Cyanobacteria bacterium Co-bin8]
MNFFEHQDEARRNTNRLVVLFAVAIATMILAFYIVALLILSQGLGQQMGWWQPDLLVLVAIATLAIIGFGSLTKMAQLKGGGSVVASSLGGRQLSPQTDDPAELQLLNVVAEMSLAAGTPLPAVYLLDHEPGINAFAAGHSPDDAVIGVTRGCLDQLNRDELQGVIGHEFSHILNGDMRLNLRLIGVLQGLLMIYILGRLILRVGAEVRIGSSGKRDKESLNVALLAGLAMIGIGGIGLVFGRLIKSAVSRQREFLADASAVQFTRNPHGITDALRKIGGYTKGSEIAAPRAEEASHLFFGEALSGLSFMGDLFATHPPLKDRIRRLGGTGVTAVASGSGPTPMAQFLAEIAAPDTEVMALQGGAGPSTAPAVAQSPEAFIAAVGTLSPQNLASAHTFLKELPAEIVTALRQPEGAIALIYALLLDAKAPIRSLQIAILKESDLAAVKTVVQLADLLKAVDTRQHLSLVDLTVPALRTLTAQQCSAFFNQIKALMRADKQLSISEYVLQLILQKRLRPHFQTAVEQPQEIASIDLIWSDCLAILSVLARLGHKNAQDATYAFKSGLYRLPGAKKRELPNDLPPVKLYDLGQSLSRVGQAVPKLKQAVVDACAHTVLVDNDVTPREAELLRAIVITLDCPIPPFLEAIRYN